MFRRLLLIVLGLASGVAVAVINGHDVEHSSTDASASLVALQMSERQPDGSTRYYKGTAFLIGPELLLTAGHNVAYLADPSDVEAIFASSPCWGSNVCHERRIKSIRTVVHPRFRQIAGGTEYDLAVVELAAPAPDDYRVIRLANRPTEVGAEPIQILGFGTDREEVEVPLSEFRLRSIGLTAIEASYRLGSEQKFWLDQRRGGICSGDSGGPAIVGKSSLAVIGLAIHVTYSEGVSHCLTRSAFTDLLFFKQWIDEAIGRLRFAARTIQSRPIGPSRR